MDKNTLKYPLGIQTFDKLIEEGFTYIDKTEYVYQMTHSNSSYVFLSRPRRFGKSLLCSTLKCYFEGRRELFKGLAIDRLEQEWPQHPVLHFSMASAKHVDTKALLSELNLKLLGYEAIYGKGEGEDNPNQRLLGLVKRAHKQTGQKVVLIFDEYDAPLLDVAHEDDTLKELRQIMRNFYSPIKDLDPHLRFVFLTGITKFSQVSIFSELNNLKNISMEKKYAGICGITEDEMLSQFDAGIAELAEELEISKDDAIQALKDNYDGYHFSSSSPDIYNPFSLLNALDSKDLGSYWFASGTPTYLIEMLRKFNVTPSMLGSQHRAAASTFDAPVERMRSVTPLLYHSGYITIKDYDKFTRLYTLGIPNREIRIGLMENLIPNYLGYHTDNGINAAAEMQGALLMDDIDRMFQFLHDFLGTIPDVDYVNKAENYEAHWQQMLYIIFSLLGATCDVEVRTLTGRVDMVARTARNLYLIEVKLNKSAEAAMEQINLKDYAQRFALSGLPIVKVGVNFDQETRNITWEINR